jgi:CRISPR system Cascade subunit CasB
MTAPVTAPTTPAKRRPYFWERLLDENGRWRARTGADGADLAALRRGIGRDAGTVPAMWPYYTQLRPDGGLTRWLRAEHLALSLWAVHQQSRPTPMHRHDVGLGTALATLRDSGKFSPDAVDRRFAAAATATSLDEVAVHLRGLITQLRGIDQPVDYTRLARDLAAWADPEQRGRIRRQWGGQYFQRTRETPDDGTASASGSSAANT